MYKRQAFTEVADRWTRTVRAAMDAYAAQIDAGDYAGGEFPLRLNALTLDLLVHASEDRGVAAELPELMRGLVTKAIAAGHGDDSYARLVEFMRQGGGAEGVG